MAIKYYKKFYPKTPVRIGQHSVSFPTLDNIVGYFATDNATVQSEFSRLIENQQGGVSEISEADYNSAYLEKKNNGTTSPRQYREELGRNGLQSGQQTIHSSVVPDTAKAAVVREGKGAQIPVTIAEASEAPKVPLSAAPAASGEHPVSPITPALGKRQQRVSA